MTVIFAVDPGSKESGYVFLEAKTGKVTETDKIENEGILALIAGENYDEIVIEMPRSFVASPHVDATIFWVGRFYQQVANCRDGVYVSLMHRDAVLKGIFGKVIQSRKGQPSRDSRVIAEMKAAYSPENRKGVSKDAWQALALAHVYKKENGL